MARLLFFFFAGVTALAFGLGWLADRPGRVVMDWQGYRIETSVAVLIVGLILFFLLLLLVLRFLRWIFFGHARSVEWRLRRSRQKGDKALARGLTALATGDTAQAVRQARRAETYLKNSPFVPLLQAQAARLEGDTLKAAGFYKQLAKHPETDLLGLRGLLHQALEAGDHDAAHKLAARAVSLRPRTRWALNALFDLSLQARDWKEAERATGNARKAGLFGPEEARRRNAIVTLMDGEDRLRAGDDSGAEAQFLKAQKACPTLLPAGIHAAQALVKAGKDRKARAIIKATWKDAPHPALADLYRRTLRDKPGAEAMRDLEALVADNSKHEESRLTLAGAALDAGLATMARDALAPLLEAPTPRSARLMARIAAAEGDEQAERFWLDKALNATRPDARWRCHHCGWEPADWTPLCERCQTFDSIAWETLLLALDRPVGPEWKRLADPGLIG